MEVYPLEVESLLYGFDNSRESPRSRGEAEWHNLEDEDPVSVDVVVEDCEGEILLRVLSDGDF